MPKKVLVVDDDRMSVVLIQFALKEQNYEVLSAEDGLKGLEAVKSFNPDLIVLDVQMPNMSGFEFISELKAIPGGSAIPVIMLTANENMHDMFYGEGVKGYFVKPIEPPKLMLKIRECLGA
jgi:CheY-like chemotaxis protein